MSNEIGNLYGTMTVIELLPNINPTGKKSIRMVKVKCKSCSTITEKRLDNIKRKGTSGCSRNCPGFKATITKHGLSNSRVYKSWDNMVSRCTRGSHESFEHYDNLIIGEKIDPRWFDFSVFIEDMGQPASMKTKFSIDRIDNRKGYFKENCRWATQSEQCQNQEKSIVNKFTSEELKTIKDFYELCKRFKDGRVVFTTKTIMDIFKVSSSTVTKILDSTYINQAKDKERAAQKTSTQPN